MNKKIKELERKLEKLDIKLKEKEIKIRVNNGKRTRKERANHLIRIGALLEMIAIDNENPALILGFLLTFYDLTQIQKSEMKLNGEIYMYTRNKMKESDKQ